MSPKEGTCVRCQFTVIIMDLAMNLSDLNQNH